MIREMPSVRILGSTVHLLSVPEIVALMERWIAERPARCRHIVVTGFHGLWVAHNDPSFKAILRAADLWVPDGIAPVWIARSAGHRNVHRVPGADLMRAFFEVADKRGYRSFFFGDTDETLGALRARLEVTYPGHTVAGTFSPPFRPVTPKEDEDHIRMINQAKPDVVWVGLGLPKQDCWIHDHRDRLEAPIAVSVGAAFMFLAGKVKRAPAWVGNIGLEWLWRLTHEPRKLWRRSLLEGPRFVVHVVAERLGLRQYT